MKIGIAWMPGSASMLLLCACLSGCVGKGNDNTTIPVSTQVDTYVGTQHTTGTYEGVYSLTVDHTTNYFNIADVSSYSIGGDFNYVGNLTAASPQFQNMNITDPAPLAVTPLMLEVPGDAAVVELYFEGYLPPVVFAASSGCQAVAGATTYQLIQLDDGLTENYGTITVNRGQSDWTFSNFDLLQIDGTDNKPAALNPGACAQSAEGFATTIPVTVLGLPLTYTVAISPNGYLIMDRDEGEAPTVVRSANVPLQPLDITQGTLAATDLRCRPHQPPGKFDLWVPGELQGCGSCNHLRFDAEHPRRGNGDGDGQSAGTRRLLRSVARCTNDHHRSRGADGDGQ